MLTPGELEKGQWIIIHEDQEDDKPWQESQVDNPIMALFGMGNTKPIPSPHLVLAIQLPYVVVCDTANNPMITKIWDVRKVKLMELETVWLS